MHEITILNLQMQDEKWHVWPHHQRQDRNLMVKLMIYESFTFFCCTCDARIYEYGFSWTWHWHKFKPIQIVSSVLHWVKFKFLAASKNMCLHEWFLRSNFEAANHFQMDFHSFIFEHYVKGQDSSVQKSTQYEKYENSWMWCVKNAIHNNA